MPFDGLTLAGVCQELNAELTGARIYKIYQPEKDELTLVVRKTDHNSVNLVISANAAMARIYLAKERKENPQTAPAFCMLLRKYLEGARITAVTQPGLERVITLHLDTLNDFREWEPKELCLELMGKHSNIILLKPEDSLILDAIKRYSFEVSAHRQLLPGFPYTPPPKQDKLEAASLTLEALAERLYTADGFSTLSQGITASITGFSPAASRQLCLRQGIDPLLGAEVCGEYELTRVLEGVKAFTAHPQSGYVLLQGETAKDFSAYPFAPVEGELVQFPTVNAACDYYFAHKIKKARLELQRTNLSRKVKQWLDKAYKKSFLQGEDQKKSRQNVQYKVWGELLTAYAHQLKKGDLKAELVDFYTGEPVVIALDPRYTPIEAAQRYFKLYNKSQAALHHLRKLTQETQAEVDYLESVMAAIAQAESLADLTLILQELRGQNYLKTEKTTRKEAAVKLPPRRFISSDGCHILVGRNNQQNDWLTLKAADKNDLWLHTQKIHGAHVIIDLPEGSGSIQDIPDRTLEEAAVLAAYYSNARNDSKVPVDYTFRGNVKKPSGAKPGMVVYDQYWTLLADPGKQTLPEAEPSKD
jgi:predicted ribosome quality control (RQC) complex YloA/Tae2 family protein